MTASLATPLVPTSPSGPDAIPFAHTCAGAPEEAARQLADHLLSCRPSGVLFFCSAEYDLDALGQALERHFGGVPLCGCTTAGELTTQGYARGGVVAIGFPDRDFAFAHAVIDDLDNVSLPAAQTLVDTLLGECQAARVAPLRSEEHTSELQSRPHLVCRLLLEKKKNTTNQSTHYTAQQPTCSTSIVLPGTAVA